MHLYTAATELSDGTGLIMQVPLQLNNAALVYSWHGALEDGTGLIMQVPLQLNNAALLYRCHGALRWDRSDYAGSTAAQ